MRTIELNDQQISYLLFMLTVAVNLPECDQTTKAVCSQIIEKLTTD